ncbi:MAG: tetratricopeptide repeat protein, partial [Thermoproteota archaeon]|nr:tetratricopeptide repeat protein [Thermoproteota archaeon]
MSDGYIALFLNQTMLLSIGLFWFNNVKRWMNYIHHIKGMFDKALDKYNQSLEKAKDSGDMVMIALNLNHMAEIYYIKGMYDQAINLYNQSLNMAKELGDQYGMCQTLNNISAIYHNKGEYGYALYYAIWSYEHLKRL